MTRISKELLVKEMKKAGGSPAFFISYILCIKNDNDVTSLQENVPKNIKICLRIAYFCNQYH
jgi:hypothetical protein